MSRKIIYPAASPVTVLLDPADDAAVTRAALAAHNPSAGRVTVHPTPAASARALALDILAALGKPTELPGDWGTQGPPVFNIVGAWILALPITRLTVLRAHLLDEKIWSALLALRLRTGVHLVAVCHTRRPPAVVRTALRDIDHHTVSTDHHVGDLLAKAPTVPPPRRGAQGRWITVPALAYLDSHQDFPDCHCTPPQARRPYVPERAYGIDQLAHRLATRTAYPQLVGALATAVFTGAPSPSSTPSAPATSMPALPPSPSMTATAPAARASSPTAASSPSRRGRGPSCWPRRTSFTCPRAATTPSSPPACRGS
uniref:Uncharacterized protein n=1 Tax=Streptomyces sp. NBC_00180 TaxID=2903632 RepID=A0AAU1I9U2_9ACTN